MNWQRRSSLLRLALLLVVASASALADAPIALRNVWNGDVTRVDDIVAITYATARVPDDDLCAPLEAAGVRVEVIGDSDRDGTGTIFRT